MAATRGTSAGMADRSASTPSQAPNAPSAAPSERQEKAFDEQGADQIPARGAERRPDARARGCARSSRTSMRLARFTQAMSRTKPTAAEQHEHPGAHAARQVLAQRLDLGDPVLEPARRLGGQPRGDLIHLRLRLLERHAVAKPADDLQAVGEARCRARGRQAGTRSAATPRSGGSRRPDTRRRAASRRGSRSRRAGPAAAGRSTSGAPPKRRCQRP